MLIWFERDMWRRIGNTVGLCTADDNTHTSKCDGWLRTLCVPRQIVLYTLSTYCKSNLADTSP